jgi:dynein heavy chain
MLKIGEQEYVYHQDFKFFMTSRMANPHLVPEITIKVIFINYR